VLRLCACASYCSRCPEASPLSGPSLSADWGGSAYPVATLPGLLGWAGRGATGCSGLSKPFFAELLATFARETGAGRERSIVLVLDNAGWHGPEGLAIPDGISLVFLPPYSPELQPAEKAWTEDR
jgi:DDE superfamily endonuclease